MLLGLAKVPSACRAAPAGPDQRAGLPAHRGDRKLPRQCHLLDPRLAADRLEQLPARRPAGRHLWPGYHDPGQAVRQVDEKGFSLISQGIRKRGQCQEIFTPIFSAC